MLLYRVESTKRLVLNRSGSFRFSQSYRSSQTIKAQFTPPPAHADTITLLSHQRWRLGASTFTPRVHDPHRHTFFCICAHTDKVHELFKCTLLCARTVARSLENMVKICKRSREAARDSACLGRSDTNETAETGPSPPDPECSSLSPHRVLLKADCMEACDSLARLPS